MMLKSLALGKNAAPIMDILNSVSQKFEDVMVKKQEAM